jgi:hypothetical protein
MSAAGPVKRIQMLAPAGRDPAIFRLAGVRGVRCGHPVHSLSSGFCTGPAGETCRTCRHCVRLQHSSKTFLKCGLCERQWTHGLCNDIRARWPACKFWEAVTIRRNHG